MTMTTQKIALICEVYQNRQQVNTLAVGFKVFYKDTKPDDEDTTYSFWEEGNGQFADQQRRVAMPAATAQKIAEAFLEKCPEKPNWMMRPSLEVEGRPLRMLSSNRYFCVLREGETTRSRRG